MSLELHPLCTLFPRLTGAEFDALCADIKANGLREPITTHDGMVLDGGNRYRACVAVGVEPKFREFDGGNLVSFVLSANLHRRHLSEGQHAAIVASCTNWATAQTHGGARRGDQAATLPLETVRQRATAAGVGERTQRMADKVAKADPALAREVAHGNVSLPKAVQQIAPKPAAKTAKQIEAEQAAEDAFGDSDPLQMVEELQRENEKLVALVKAAEADDLKAEAMKWRRSYEHALRQQSEAMDRASKSVEREAWTVKQLRRCGKAIGEEDPTKIAAAVEAFVRQHKKVAA